MYTAIKNYDFRNEAGYSNAAQAIAKARKIAAKKKGELEVKLIFFLLIAGNAVALSGYDFSERNFFGFFLIGLLVTSAVFTIGKNILRSFVKSR